MTSSAAHHQEVGGWVGGGSRCFGVPFSGSLHVIHLYVQSTGPRFHSPASTDASRRPLSLVSTLKSNRNEAALTKILLPLFTSPRMLTDICSVSGLKERGQFSLQMFSKTHERSVTGCQYNDVRAPPAGVFIDPPSSSCSTTAQTSSPRVKHQFS